MDTPFIESYGLIIILFCLVISAFFSSAETAITSLSNLRTRHLLESQGVKYKALKLWLRFPSRVLATILVFNNAVNILASAIATTLASHYFHSQAVGIATGITTFCVIIFGEILPKSIAKVYAESWAVISLRIIEVIYVIFFPLIWVLSEFTAYAIKLFGNGKGNPSHPPITEEELGFLVNVGEQTGVLDNQKTEMLNEVLRFDETKVREIMTPRIDMTAVDGQTPLKDVARIMKETGHSRIPIYQKSIDQIIGSVLAKDLLALLAEENQGNTPVINHMRKVHFVPESKLIDDVFRELNRTKNHMAIVVDEHGGTSGLVTMEDIIEEVFGEIQDEFDAEQHSKINELDHNSYEIAGSLPVDEFLDYFELEEDTFNEEDLPDVDTMGGWVTQILGELPKNGQKTNLGPFVVEVIKTKRHRIDLMKVSRIIEGPVLAAQN